MIKVTTYDASGRFQFNLKLLDEAEADMNGQWVYGHWSPDTHYAEAGEAVSRPMVTLPISHTLPVYTDWTLPSIPQESEIHIDQEPLVDDEGVVYLSDISGVTLSFEVPGKYQVEVRPPFPWRSVFCEVAVS